MATESHIKATLFSNASPDRYELIQAVDLSLTLNWVVCLCEISCFSPPMGKEETTALMYFNLISPQFVGDSTVRCMRTFVTHHHLVGTSIETCTMCLLSRGEFRTF